jgi:hypothetical protein
LRHSLGIHDWSATLACDDVQNVYNEFLDVVKYYLEHCVPLKTVRMGRRDPEFITPYIKGLLNKRNRLRKQGKYELADNLANIINGAIASNVRHQLSKLVDSPVHAMWDALHTQNNVHKNNIRASHLPNDVEQVNSFFASYSYDPSYKAENVSAYRPSSKVSDFQPLYAYEIEPLLRRVVKTAPGRDNIPHWVYSTCSFELADVVTHIYNLTLCTGVIPSQWLTAVITPVPKIPNPGTLSDFRPISVTPILSRIIEKLVVSRWLRPVIPPDLISDQFAFRPTGSTTCALVYFMHHVTRLLETNAYVRCLLIDFSKAFDVVDHVVLVDKLSKLKLPKCVLNWLISFLEGRSHTTKTAGVESNPLSINLSIVQGSGIGPTFYIILESDLKPVSNVNIVFKYADDTNLLVPEYTDVQLCDEYEAIQLWALRNKMIINTSKTKEIVFRRPNPRACVDLPALLAIEKIKETKLLGVIFSDSFHFDSHVNYILKICSQRSYLMRKLRDQGLTANQLNIVFDAIILSRITYGVCAWSGFLSTELIGRIDAFLRRMFRYGFCKQLITFRDISGSCDSTLFKVMLKSDSCIHQLLPSVKNDIMQLRPRGHKFTLPNCISNLHKASFVNRCLFNYI